MSLHRLLLVAGAIGLVVGCSGEVSPQQSRQNFQESRARVIDGLQDAASVSRDLGHDIEYARGWSEGCNLSSRASAGYEYRATVVVGPVDRPVAEQLEDFVAALDTAGWEGAKYDDNAKYDPDAPLASASRDGVRVTITPPTKTDSRTLKDGALRMSFFSAECVTFDESVDEPLEEGEDIALPRSK